jgi:hypothetical protein
VKNTKVTLIPIIIFFLNSILISQSYLGVTSQNVNLREGPGTEHNILKLLKQNSYVFIYSLEKFNDFYLVIDIETNIEGFVHKNFTNVLRAIDKNEEGIFEPIEKISNINPSIEIYNNTPKTLTLKMNDVRYTFHAYEKKTLEFSPGIYDYYASAPLVIPDYGSEKLENYYSYAWEFYIITTSSPISKKKKRK